MDSERKKDPTPIKTEINIKGEKRLNRLIPQFFIANISLCLFIMPNVSITETRTDIGIICWTTKGI
jgi:hypothetical protein